jgi:hypothetical protein
MPHAHTTYITCFTDTSIMLIKFYSLKVCTVLGKTNRILSLIRDGPHWKRRVQQYFYCCVCIRYRGNDRGIFTKPLSSDDRVSLPSRCLATIGGFLLSRCLPTTGRFLPSRCLATIDGLLLSRCLATIWGILPSRCLATIGGYTDTHTHTDGNVISWAYFYFFKIRKLG